MDSGLMWLTAASATIWLGICCYLALLAANQAALARRVRQLEQIHNDSR